MSFQDIRNNSGIRPISSQTPSQSIAAGNFQIETAVSAFRGLVESIGTSKVPPNHRQKLHNKRQRILQLVEDTSAKLKALSESDHSANVTLARDFQASLQEFQKVEQLASERESSYMPSGAPTLSVTDSIGEEAKQDIEIQPFLVEQKRPELVLLDNEITFNEAVIEERDQRIKEIQGQIGQFNEIFKDFAALVHGQGVVIDDIHSNIESSAAVITQARQQISKASKSERSGSTWAKMAFSTLIGATGEIMRRCHCGIPVALMRSWSEHNPGRRFVACKFYNPDRDMRGCRFFEWVDEGINHWQKEGTNGLLKEKKALENKVKLLKEQLSADKKKNEANCNFGHVDNKKGVSIIGCISISLIVSIVVVKVLG